MSQNPAPQPEVFSSEDTPVFGIGAASCPQLSAEAGSEQHQFSYQPSKYHREIKPGVFVDIYDVLDAWSVTNAALQHLIKKALQPGERGHKTLAQDLDDIIASAKRAKELEE